MQEEFSQFPPPSNSPLPGDSAASPATPILLGEPPRPPRVRALVVLLAFLLGLWLIPSLARHISHSITLGRMQAEAEVARQRLDEGPPISLADFRWVVKAVEPSVVGVKSSHIVAGHPDDELSAMFGATPQYRAQEQGSGVIVDTKGYIVTNYHVVNGASDVDVIAEFA